MLVRDLLTRLSATERTALTNRVQTTVLGAELWRSMVTEPDAARETVEDLDERVTMMIEELTALRGMLRQPALR
jgi:hypothetical protein